MVLTANKRKRQTFPRVSRLSPVCKTLWFIFILNNLKQINMAYSHKQTACPSCRNTISIIASTCPYCHSKILKITEKGIMYDEKVPLKIKRFLRFAPLICSVITFLFFNQVTNKGLIDWLIIILATLGVYIFIYIFLRMNITHNETKN